MPKRRKILIVLFAILLLCFILFSVFNIKVLIMKKIYPKKYEKYVEVYAKKYEVDPLLIYAIIKTESNFNANVKSNSDAIGLMQLMNETGVEIANEIKEQEDKKSKNTEDGAMENKNNKNDENNENELDTLLELKNVSTESLYIPEVNIQIGTYYFSKLVNQYKNTGMALAAYNAGMGRVAQWIQNGNIKSDGSDLENIPYKETNMYVRKVLNNYRIYQELYESN